MTVQLDAFGNGTNARFNDGGIIYTMFIPKSGVVEIPHESGDTHFLVSPSGRVTCYKRTEILMQGARCTKCDMPNNVFAKVVKAVVKNFDRNTTIEI